MIFLKDYNKTAIIYNDREYSYKEVILSAKSFSERIDIKKEDRVIIFMENRPELLFSFLGIWNKQGTCVCLDGGFSGEELVYYIKDSEPKYIFTSQVNYKEALKAVELAGMKDTIKILVVDDIPIDYKGEDLTVEIEDKYFVSLILYTSGTTGNPKGVMLTFDNILVNMEGLDKYEMFKTTDRVLALLPMHHIFPLLGAGVVPLGKGSTIVFLKEVSSQAMVEALKKYKITFIIGVPKLWEMLHKKIMEKINSGKITKTIFKLAEKIDSKCFSRKIFKKVHEGFGGNIRFFVSGGSKLDPQISRDFLTLGIEVCEGYGLTETSPMISFTPTGEIVPGSAGKILNGVKVKIAEDGEILAKGRNVMKGYYKRPEATAEVIDADGWFHTGDLGELKNEFLYVTGRKKEMIVLSNGKNINPIEIEQWIMANTNLIKEMAIMDYEDRLTAVIYPDFYKLHEEGITNIVETFKKGVIDKYNKQALSYKKVLDVKIVQEELPKTKIGKIRRFMLKDVINKKEEKRENIKEPTTEEYKNIANFLKTIKNKPIIPTAHFELDLGLDSLDTIELLSHIEGTFGVKIDEQTFIEYCTVEKLAEYVEKHSSEIINDTKMDWKEILLKDGDGSLPKSNRVGKIIKFILKPAFTFFIKLKKENMENVEKNQPVIFAGNHQSFLDGLIVSQVIPNSILDKSYYFADIKHFKKGYMKYIGENSNIIFVDINKNLINSLQLLSKAIRSGKNIIIFPEGTRSRDGKMMKFKKFFAILSKELNVPVVPFVIDGAYEAYPPNKKYPKAGTVKVKFLEKVYPENMDYDEIVEKVYKKIYDEVN
ncbi:AMP-binding protein [Fusobacterium sp.]|uniref:AMP-binding protein n=1 Tax=Fusobacterium sp. TaxID=68766 RepID=UPI0026034CA9|nr:AMP-binding protein [Fusobacterium sp.]